MRHFVRRRERLVLGPVRRLSIPTLPRARRCRAESWRKNARFFIAYLRGDALSRFWLPFVMATGASPTMLYRQNHGNRILR